MERDTVSVVAQRDRAQWEVAGCTTEVSLGTVIVWLIIIMSEKHSGRLQELSKLVKDEINIIENGGKLSSFKREVKPREKELKS